MTRHRPQTSRQPQGAHSQVLECADAYARLNKLAEDITRDIVAAVPEPALAANVPFTILVWLFIDGPARPKRIRELTGLTSGGVTPVLERLEGAGLVTRGFGGVAGDRRAILVALTPSGYAQVRAVAGIVDARLDRLFRDLGPSIARRLAAGLPADVLDIADAQARDVAVDGTDARPDPVVAIRRRTRENMLIMARVARLGAEMLELTMPLQPEHEFHQNVPLIALYALTFRGPLRPSEIALATGLSSGGVTGLVDRLERAGLATRDLGVVPGDRRGVLVRLTDAGLAGMRLRMEIQVPLVSRFLDELAATAVARALRPGISDAIA